MNRLHRNGSSRVFVALAVLLFCAGPAAAADLAVSVTNVSSKGGDIRLALYDERSYAGHDGQPIAAVTVTATSPTTTLTVRGLSPGRYAAKVFQDFDRSGAFKMNVFGYPEEPFGFSNDARPLLDQPSFARASFEVGRDRQAITIRLRGGL